MTAEQLQFNLTTLTVIIYQSICLCKCIAEDQSIRLFVRTKIL